MLSPAPARPNQAGLLLRLRVWLLACICLAFTAGRAEALSISPGLFLVQNIAPGQSMDLRNLAGFAFVVPNGEAQETTCNLTCMSPRKGGISQWEAGFEEIPDPAWCTVEKTVFAIPAKGQQEIGLTIAIPDKPEYYNRRFVLAVVLKLGANPGIGVGMALAARVLIETTPSPEAAKSGGELGFAPSTIELTGQPGAKVEGTVQVVNHGAAMALTRDRLSGVVADPVKHERFTSNGYRALGDASWLTGAELPAQLAAGAALPVALGATIPADAKPGQRSEELLFVRGRQATAPATEVISFLRVHYLVAPAPATR